MEQCKISEGGYPDFILCLGATLKDEEMFAKLKQIVSEAPELEVISPFKINSKNPLNRKQAFILAQQA